MKKIFSKTLLVLIGVLITSLTTQVWAYWECTVYFSPKSEWISAGYTYKVNTKYQESGNEWSCIAATSTGKTKSGQPVYSCQVSVYDNWSSIRTMEIQAHSGSGWAAQVTLFSDYCYTSTFSGKWHDCNYDNNVWYDFSYDKIVNGGMVYFDNSNGILSNTYKYFVVGHNNYWKTFSLSQISGTNIWYADLSGESWDDATTCGFASPTSSWETSGTDLSAASKIATAGKYTGTMAINYSNQINSGKYYLYTPASSSNGATISRTVNDSYSAALHKAQTFTVYKSIDGGSTYSSDNTSWISGYVTVDRYYLTSATESSHATGGSVTTLSSSSKSTDVIVASSVTFAGVANTGYTFTGWSNSSTPPSPESSAALTINPVTGANSKYAFFKAIQSTITLQKNDGTDAYATQTATYNETATSLAGSLPTRSGYGFDGYWTTADNSGIKVIKEDGTWKTNKDGFTDGSGKWICTSNQTLYAHWLEVGYYLSGPFTNWEATLGKFSGSPLKSSATLDKRDYSGSSYKTTFKIRQVVANTSSACNDVWYGKNDTELGKANPTASGLSSSGNNITLQVYYTGTYEFELNTSGPNVTVSVPIVNQLQIYSSSPSGDTHIGYYDWEGEPVNNKVTKTVSLSASTSYTFKAVYDSEYYSKSSATISRASNEVTGITHAGNEGNVTITTDVAGNYTFVLDMTNNKITVTYPNRYTVSTSRTPAAATDDAPTISPTPVDGYLADGATVTFTKGATINDGYSWKGWYDNEEGEGDALGTDESYETTIDGENLVVYAVYTEDLYSVSVSAGDHGRITTGSPSVTAGVATHPTITAAADDHYMFVGWECSAGVSVDDPSENSTTVTASADGTITAKFAPVWAVVGGIGGQDGVDDEMGDWDKYNGLDYTGTANEYRGRIYLAANKTYQFKICDRPNSDNLYGYGTSSNTEVSFIGKAGATAVLYSGDQHNVRIMTAGAGYYIFTWTWDDKAGNGTIEVTYPETHPSANYIYFKDALNWSPTNGSMMVHVFGGTNTGDNNKPHAGTCTFAGSTYYYAALGDNTSLRFAASNNTANNSSCGTGDLNNITANKGKYWEPTSTSSEGSWKTFDVTVTLDGQDPTTAAGTTSITATYGAAMPTISGVGSLPSKTGYTFGGYFASAGGNGTQYYNANGTSANAWDQTGSSPRIYAYWIPNTQTFNASSGNKWSTEANWTDGIAPKSDHPVVINAPVVVDDDDAVAGSVTFSGSGTLTIEPTGVLEVTGTITNNDASKILIKSDASHQGALIFDNSADTKATVEVYAKVATYESYQSLALPVTWAGVSESFAGSGVYTYAWKEGTGWEKRGYYDDLSAFEGIGLTQNTSHTFTVSGTLASTDNFGASLAYTTGTYQGTNVFGNSWTAPIQVNKISIDGDANKTVYVFTNGSWAAKTLLGLSDDIVVPALQAYAIIATGTGATVSIDYDEAVRKNTSSRTTPLQAPKRNTSEEMIQMNLRVSDNDTYSDLELREDGQLFTEEFDKARYLEGDGRAGQLYVQKENQMVVLAEPSLEGTVVGLIQGKSSNYTITFSGNGNGYYLNDVKEEEATLIEEGNSYNFTADEGTNSTRFVISKTPIKKTPTGVDPINDGVKARKQLIDGVLYIIRDGRIYNTEGALVK